MEIAVFTAMVLGLLGDDNTNLGFTPSAYHTYSFEVKGDTLRMSVDSGSSIQVTDSRVLSGGQVGLWSVNLKANVTDFKVIAL